MDLRRNSQEKILSTIAHRPYSMPARPWRMTQRWNDLLFAHWPVPAQMLAHLLPPGLEVDTFEGSGWVGVVPFSMDHVQMRGVPRIPGTSRFPELNLRTYVRDRNTNRAGVYFFCLEAANPLAVAIARGFYHLPYHWARISVTSRGERDVSYTSERLFTLKPVRFRAHYRGLGRVNESNPAGSIEHFLAERYCLFTTNRRGELLRGEIHHLPWPLEAAEAEIEKNELPSACGIRLPDTPPILHYSRELVVYLWSLDQARWAKLAGLEAVGARPAEV